MGHEMTPENTYTRANGHTVCKACRKLHGRGNKDRYTRYRRKLKSLKEE